ncbi:ferritin-like domain-containing protein [Bacillus luteolus]|uniref:Ferritin-like domain-containing protein n=1 Tax=Litchfieldia luteola TaxID=682179 RepID=A0ABR9QGF9_9BACI|nr:ferritin-like domain-containing protein [Cytobacillus luteolus]MBE4907587.1 ferritin-like domain-containing protein [Cytobacillus luteolus]MBP1944362.1 rubrerythrin [Cytobacillus luteolus]
MNQYNNYYSHLRNTAQLIRDIQKAINGEYSAIACYEKLAQLAPSPLEKEQILEIREDEQRHYEEFRKIYRLLVGNPALSEHTEECPDSYIDGVEFSFVDEQKTVDFYLDIADQSEDPYIKKTFQRAAADEQNHAVWFLFFSQKNQ